MSRCNFCQHSPLLPVIHFGCHPIAHHYLTHPAATEPNNEVDLRICQACGLTQLNNPIAPERFYTNYITLSSWKPQPHVPHLLELIARLPGVTKQTHILEVGSNDGAFCRALMNAGYESVVGVEPAVDAQLASRDRGVATVCGYFTPELAGQLTKCDLLVTRQVMEHIQDLPAFCDAIKTTLRPGGHLLVEVPNFELSLVTCDYSAIWEEHVNYYTFSTLAHVLRSIGVTVIHREVLTFSGQALLLIGRLDGAEPEGDARVDPQEMTDKLMNYAIQWPTQRYRMLCYLSEQRQAGRRIAVYGAGSRVTSLINFMSLAPYIDLIVDDQVEKQGKYVPGANLKIHSSAALQDADVDICLLAVNAENEESVISKHMDWARRGGEFHSLFPPSARLLPSLKLNAAPSK